MHGSRKASFLCQAYLFRANGEAFEAGEDVGVFVLEAKVGGGGDDEVIQVPLLEGLQSGILGTVKIENDGAGTGFENAVEFLEAGGDINHVAEAVAHGEAVEVVVGEGELKCVAFDPSDGLMNGGTLGGDRQLFRREIQTIHMTLGANLLC